MILRNSFSHFSPSSWHHHHHHFHHHHHHHHHAHRVHIRVQQTPDQHGLRLHHAVDVDGGVGILDQIIEAEGEVLQGQGDIGEQSQDLLCRGPEVDFLERVL